jgi:excisionase family DNA binding protein
LRPAWPGAQNVTNLKTLSTPIAYTLPDFCLTYGIGRTTAYRLIDAGELEARKVGRRTVIDAASAARWYASLPMGVTA